MYGHRERAVTWTCICLKPEAPCLLPPVSVHTGCGFYSVAGLLRPGQLLVRRFRAPSLWRSQKRRRRSFSCPSLVRGLLCLDGLNGHPIVGRVEPLQCSPGRAATDDSTWVLVRDLGRAGEVASDDSSRI
jgi:hypothetical protein